ncbi:MAG: hypothetical protein IKX31_07600, partial [Muribaculaceae bacterium]|nr:hypothetical protein [Muribaculaceae bacterium]
MNVERSSFHGLDKNFHFFVFFLGLFFVNTLIMLTFAVRECVQLRLTHAVGMQPRLIPSF